MITRSSVDNLSGQRRFLSHYGVSPQIVSILWDSILLNLPPKCCSIHLLWCLLFLKVYASEAILSSIVGTNEKKYREHVWPVMRAIAALRVSTVSFLIAPQCLLSPVSCLYFMLTPMFSHRFLFPVVSSIRMEDVVSYLSMGRISVSMNPPRSPVYGSPTSLKVLDSAMKSPLQFRQGILLGYMVLFHVDN